MIRNYEPSKIETITHYTHDFTWVDQPSSGFSFNVDEQGNLLPDTPEKAAENYALCKALTQTGQITDHGINTNTDQYRHPATGTCNCGSHLHLNGDTTCTCGRHYNAFGQELHSLHDHDHDYDYRYDY